MDAFAFSHSGLAVHGTHFGAFARLFAEGGLPKRCAIVADADLPEDVEEGQDVPPPANLQNLVGPYVRAFVGATTFERELTSPENLPMLAAAAQDLGAVRTRAALTDWIPALRPIEDLKDQVLRTATRFGKARFAQVVTRHINQAGAVPQYIRDALDWLRE